MGSRSRASSHLRVLRPFAHAHELLDVDAGGLQTLARVDEAREFEEATVVAVRVVGVLQRRECIHVNVCAFEQRLLTR